MVFLARAWRRLAGGISAKVLASLAATVLALSFHAPSQSRTILDLTAPDAPVPLADWGDFRVDRHGDLQADEVVAAKDWRPTSPDDAYALQPGQALWIRFTVPPAPDFERWYLEIADPSVDRATLFTRNNAGGWSAASAGTRLPVAQWAVPHRRPLLPVSVSAETPSHFLLKIEHHRPLRSLPVFVSDSYVSQRDQRVSLLLGLYFGFAALAAATGLLHAVSQKDSAYAHVAVAVAAMGLAQVAHTGIGGLHLWPLSAWWNDKATTVLTLIAAGAMTWTYAHMVSLAERSRVHFRALAIVALAALPLAVAGAFAPAHCRTWLVGGYAGISAAACLAAVAWAARRGDRHALPLLASTLPVLTGAALFACSEAGWLPGEAWTSEVLQVATALQWPVLLLVLTLRNQERRENRRRVAGLERVDPETGLVNDYEFRARLHRVIARATRMKYRSIVLMVDIVNVPALREEYAEEGMKDLQLRVASRLLSTTRDVDTVARLGAHRFGVLVEGPFPPGEECQLGARIVARCLRPYYRKPNGWMPRIHVAQCSLPLGVDDADGVIRALSLLLSSVPADSRRTVFTLGGAAAATPHAGAAPQPA